MAIVRAAFVLLSLLCGVLFLAACSNATISKEEDERNKDFHYIQEEEFEIGLITSLKVFKTPLDSFQSNYQHIEVYQSADSSYFGKILLLDENIQLTERDAASYNEMMAHVPMMAHPHPKRILVIGGGDGYVVSEVLKHPSVSHVDHVELDRGVIDVSQRNFPWATNLWDHPKVALHITDGAQFVRTAPTNYYDVVIQDSSDPQVVEADGVTVTVLPSSVLYEREHFQHLTRILTSHGIFTFQAETYNIPSSLQAMKQWRRIALQAGFQSVRYATIAIPTYSTGQIGMYVCQKQQQQPINDTESISERFHALIGSSTLYYHPPLQKSSFDLPFWVEKYLYSDDDDYTKDEL